MGAVTFSLDSRLVTALQSEVKAGIFVETGTYKGDTVLEMMPFFEKIFSVELSKSLFESASRRFENFPQIAIFHGNSQDKLRALRQELHGAGVLYWLDAHWCVASDTAGALSQCPILEELQAIGALNSESVVLIDDARLFLAPPRAPPEISQWPSFHQIVSSLFSMSDKHELMVVNDVIAFYPRCAKSAVMSYAQNFGVDWLTASNCLKENGSFISQLEEKERVIRQLDSVLLEREQAITEKERALLEKDSVILEQTKAIKAYRAAFCVIGPLIPCAKFFLRPLWKPLARLKKILSPRLGNLNQYHPRELRAEPLNISTKDLSIFPRFSIVTPSYGQGRFIERTILSVVGQGYERIEYFVQDGGSTDSTISILEKYDHELSGWVSEKDSGQSQAINRGFSNTSGDVMAWINSDDLLLPGTLCVVADYFNRHPDVDVVYGDRLLIDENDMEIGRWIMPGHDNDVLSWADFVPQETLFWRRTIWEKAGGKIDETFRFAMDWELLVRFRDCGARFAHIPKFLGAFRVHRNQKTSAEIGEVGRREMDQIRARVLGRVPSCREIRMAVFPYLLKHVVIDLAYRIKKKLGKFS